MRIIDQNSSALIKAKVLDLVTGLPVNASSPPTIQVVEPSGTQFNASPAASPSIGNYQSTYTFNNTGTHVLSASATMPDGSTPYGNTLCEVSNPNNKLEWQRVQGMRIVKAAGQSITFQAAATDTTYQAYTGGSLQIVDPLQNVQATITMTLSGGVFSATYNIPTNATLGLWEGVMTFTLSGSPNVVVRRVFIVQTSPFS